MKKRDDFIIITSLLAAAIAGLYLYQAITEGFHIAGWLIIAANLIYVPGALILRRKIFVPWSIFYSLILVYTVSHTETMLFNNFTPLFVLFFVMIIKPNYKWTLVVVYAVAAGSAFIATGETAFHFITHAVRAVWLFYITDFLITNKYERKALNLTMDEIMILEELNEKQLLKACTSFSKNTLTQKLKEARERNGIPTNAELLAEYNMTKK